MAYSFASFDDEYHCISECLDNKVYYINKTTEEN